MTLILVGCAALAIGFAIGYGLGEHDWKQR
jgi:hypothetical protein